MKGLKLPDEIESKDEKSQMYLENNFNKIRNNFPNIDDTYQRFFKHTADNEKNSIDYNMLSSKVKGINFFCLLEPGAEETSKKDKSFLEGPSKVCNLKKAFAISKGGINDTEKADDDLVLSINKTIDDVFYKKANNGLSEKDKNIFQEARKLFNLMVKIYKKLIFEIENLRPEETIAGKLNLRKQRAEE